MVDIEMEEIVQNSTKLEEIRFILGWAQAINPEHNRTCHLVVVVEGTSMCRNACGSRVVTSGQVHKDPPSYAPFRCRNCTKTKAYKQLGG